MNRKTETLLPQEIAPRLRAAIPKTVPIVGADDVDEIVQDGLVIAICLLKSAKRNGKKVSGSNIAHYALLHIRSGRRSTGYKKSDVLHPAAQLNGHARVRSMDEPLRHDEDGDEPLTLHDCLAADVDDPATAAARQLDWESVLDSLDRIKKAILTALAEGTELTLLVHQLKRSRSALQDHKHRLGRLVLEQLGADILREVQTPPAWRSSLDAVRERLTCRAERRAS
jgi:hypothetical protein